MVDVVEAALEGSHGSLPELMVEATYQDPTRISRLGHGHLVVIAEVDHDGGHVGETCCHHPHGSYETCLATCCHPTMSVASGGQRRG